MPRNKSLQPADEKRAEIVDAARKLFLDTGYEAASIGAIAATAGVAPNTIYWYFKDKDEVLVAVLDRELKSGMSDYFNFKLKDSAARLLWIVERLEQASRLVTTVHARLRISPAINRWHDEFHQMSEGLARLEMHARGLPPARVDAMVKIWAFTMEGLLSHPMKPEEKRAVCAELARGLAAESIKAIRSGH